MYSRVFNINKHKTLPTKIDSGFSFKGFINDVKQKIHGGHGIKSEFYKFVLSKLKKYPVLKGRIDTAGVKELEPVLELVYSVLSPPIANEREFYWALGTPIPDKIIYCTSGFHHFITGSHSNKESIINLDRKTFKIRQERFAYRIILEKLYKITSELKNDIIYTQEGKNGDTESYLKIHIDTSYITVTTKQPLPELNPQVIEQFLQESIGYEVLLPIIPLEMFSIEGFSVITVEDVTAAYSIDKIRVALVNDAEDPNILLNEVTHALQTLTGYNTIEFGLLPFLKINGKLVFDTEECFSSVLINGAIRQKMAESSFNASIEQFIVQPRAIFFNEIEGSRIKENQYLQILFNEGIKSYAVLPVYYNHKLTGAIEIYSKSNTIQFEKLLSKLDAAVPLLSQLLHNSIEQFNLRIEGVIKEKFTTLQNAVEWKFNEAAWEYIKAKNSGKTNVEVESISFKDVYPIYGAVDIRNSTNERNDALLIDVNTTLKKLKETLRSIAEIKSFSEFKEVLSVADAWLKRVNRQVTDNDEMNIKSFLEGKVYPLFDELRVTIPESNDILDSYFEIVDEVTGEGFARRRILEESIGLINTSLNNFFEREQKKLQKIYPCYFEKFRTDGVEYDIYTGQAIAPGIPFHEDRITDFRHWQLTSMIDIVNITNKISASLDCKLQTTQLIFVHPGPIDICFRKDERRFDVEGAYNIRYEVIKKRIDKVLIKNTSERLTQPGHIAIVYYNESEAEEFLAYIRQAQKSGKLDGETQFHDLEELQGVTGLKAIRIKVNTGK